MNLKSSRPPRPTDAAAGDAAGRKRKKLRKDDIVIEATRLFAERGYEGASMGDLAERVGLRKASLFHHFPSKDALYATVLEHLLEGVKGAIIGAAQAEGSFEVRLDAMSDAITSTLGAQPHAARLLLREAMDWGPVIRDRLGRTINDVLAAALEFCKAGQRAGVFNPDLDMRQFIVSLIGVYFMPFAIGELVERFTGTSPFHTSFVDERTVATRDQVRLLLLCSRRGAKS